MWLRSTRSYLDLRLDGQFGLGHYIYEDSAIQVGFLVIALHVSVIYERRDKALCISREKSIMMS